MDESEFEASSGDLVNAICTTVGSGSGPERYMKSSLIRPIYSVRLKCNVVPSAQWLKITFWGLYSNLSQFVGGK